MASGSEASETASPAVPDSPATSSQSLSNSTWRFGKASRAHVVVDAADYYALMREAMLKAQHRIMLIGWDFDTRIELKSNRRGEGGRQRGEPPEVLGDFIVWLTKRSPELEVRVLKWNFGALKMLLRGAMMLHIVRWWWNRQIDFKFDTAHPVGMQPPPEDRGHRRLFRGLRRHRHDRRALGHARPSRGRSPAQAAGRPAIRALARLHDDDGGRGRRPSRRIWAASAGSRPAARRWSLSAARGYSVARKARR